MRKLKENKILQFVFMGVLLATVPFLAQYDILPRNYVVVFASVIIYGIAALGLNVLLGFSGLISLGTAGFMGLGAYLSAYFTGQMGLPFELSLILSVLIPTLLGLLVGLVSLKIEGLYLAIATLAVSEVFREIFIQFDTFTGGASGAQASYPKLLFGALSLDRESTYIFITIVMVIVVILAYYLLNGYIGRAFNAMRGSEHAAQAMGISLFRYRLLSFAFATALAALAGVLYVHIIRLSYPSSWTLNTSLDSLAVVVIGGFRSIYGTFIGSFIVYAVSELFLKRIKEIADYAYIIKGVLIIVVIMFYPGGSIQIFNDIKRKVKRLFTRKGREVEHGKST